MTGAQSVRPIAARVARWRCSSLHKGRRCRASRHTLCKRTSYHCSKPLFNRVLCNKRVRRRMSIFEHSEA